MQLLIHLPTRITSRFISDNSYHSLLYSKYIITQVWYYEHNHIENSRSTSFLGLILDRTLSWQLHIDKICAKLKSGCYILRILNSIISVSNLKTIYFSYIHSIITYGIIFWGNSTGSNEVFKLQKRLLELLQILTAKLHAVTYLKNWIFFLFNRNTYYRLQCM